MTGPGRAGGGGDDPDYPEPRELRQGAVVVIGSQADTAGFTLAGARPYPAESAEQVWAAWQAVTDGDAVVIMSAAAAELLGEARTARPAPLTVVLPR
jgi:vacuolar-type H+-ATPase subunit F/Vma7